MADKRAAVSLIDVRYAYPGSGAFSLDVPQLSFAAGVCTAVCGHNGSGKTTLGKLAAGLLRPSQGSVLLEDEDIAEWPLGRIGKQVGYLFQEPTRQIFAPTVLEEITFPLTLNGMEEEQAQELARTMLARFEMEPLADATTFMLSRGEKQRLAIAAILVNRPSFLVLDEPTTGLDARRKGILGRMINTLAEQGVGILLISHDAVFVRRYAGVTYRMAEGRML
ncbi:MAG: energy-coupling factor ABC transporter ATP-binding protein [Coriobacteriia bacterium]|nr:energy-coupling factor ABC transporter ATP-binding protein [Coriobacteriia bacterium]